MPSPAASPSRAEGAATALLGLQTSLLPPPSPSRPLHVPSHPRGVQTEGVETAGRQSDPNVSRSIEVLESVNRLTLCRQASHAEGGQEPGPNPVSSAPLTGLPRLTLAAPRSDLPFHSHSSGLDGIEHSPAASSIHSSLQRMLSGDRETDEAVGLPALNPLLISIHASIQEALTAVSVVSEAAAVETTGVSEGVLLGDSQLLQPSVVASVRDIPGVQPAIFTDDFLLEFLRDPPGTAQLEGLHEYRDVVGDHHQDAQPDSRTRVLVPAAGNLAEASQALRYDDLNSGGGIRLSTIAGMEPLEVNNATMQSLATSQLDGFQQIANESTVSAAVSGTRESAAPTAAAAAAAAAAATAAAMARARSTAVISAEYDVDYRNSLNNSSGAGRPSPARTDIEAAAADVPGITLASVAVPSTSSTLTTSALSAAELYNLPARVSQEIVEISAVATIGDYVDGGMDPDRSVPEMALPHPPQYSQQADILESASTVLIETAAGINIRASVAAGVDSLARHNVVDLTETVAISTAIDFHPRANTDCRQGFIGRMRARAAAGSGGISADPLRDVVDLTLVKSPLLCILVIPTYIFSTLKSWLLRYQQK